MEHHNVVIIGGGPAGLAAALELQRIGVKDVVVLEREKQAGGIPRHCGHRGFGLYKNYGLLTGPALAEKLRNLTQSLDVRTATTVLEFNMRGNLRVQSASGVSELSADKIILATGARETSRAARLIGGNKLPGVMNTGEFQQRVYLNHEKPFERPVIIGSEWISYSNILTCRHAKIKPVAMIAENSQHNAPAHFAWGARIVFQTPTIRDAKLMAIHGNKKVEEVEILENGKARMIACDGVIISGKLRSESALYSSGFIERDGDAPKVSENFLTSRTNIYAVGNVLGKVETAGHCMAQGRALSKVIAA